MGDQKKPAAVTPIGSARSITGGASLVIYGKPTRQDTAIGRVETLANGAIVFLARSDKEVELSEREARAVEDAFSHAIYAAALRKETLTGFNVVRVTRTEDGAVDVTWRGKSRRMRLSKLRRERNCGGCRARVPSIYVAVESTRERYAPRSGFIEVCEECVTKGCAIPKGLHEVSA
jgi:hypothetical protein